MQLTNKFLSVVVFTTVLLILVRIASADATNFWAKCDISSSESGQCFPTVSSPSCKKNQYVDGGTTHYCCWSSSGGKWFDSQCSTINSVSLSVDKNVGKPTDNFVFTVDTTPTVGEYEAVLQYISEDSLLLDPFSLFWTTCGTKQTVTSDPWIVGTVPSSACPGISTSTNGRYVFRAYVTEPNTIDSDWETITLDSIPPTSTAQCSTDGGVSYASCKTGYYNVNVKVKPTCDDGSGSGCDKSYYCGSKDCSSFTECTANSCSATTFADDGTNYYSFYSTDKAVNKESVNKNKEIKIDKSAPTITVAGAPANWQNTDADANVGCSDGSSGCDSTSYKLKIYDANPASCPSNYADYTLSPPQKISGQKWVCAAGKDSAGNAGFSSPVEFKIEKVPPATSFSASGTSGQNSWYTTDVSVSLSCSDTGGSGCKQTQYCSGLSTCTPNTVYSSAFLLKTEGTTSVNYFSTDNAGNKESPTKSSSVKIDKTPPATKVECGIDNANYGDCNKWFGGSVYVKLSCSDATSGCKETRYCTGASCEPGSTYSSPVQITAEGTTTVRFGSTDNAGLAETTKSVNVNVDKTKPTTSILCNAAACTSDWYANSVAFTLNCNDVGGSGCKTTQYSFDGASFNAYDANSKPSRSGDGTHTISYYSEDNTGNKEDTKTATIKIDQTQPSVTVSYNPGSISVVDEITFTATASDSTSGLATVTISLDDQLKKTCSYNGETSSQNCVYASPAYGPGGAGKHTVSSTATDKAGLSKSYNGEFTVEVCNFGPVSITPLCSGGYSANCEPGEKIQVTATYSGKCPSTAYIQVDAFSNDNSCAIIDQDRTGCTTENNKLTGINVQCSSSVCVGQWTIPGKVKEFPNNCKGKTLTADGSTIRDNYPCAGGKSYNSATATGSITFWSESECNNPGVCDFPFEKQTNCPNDCKTTVAIDPYYVYPNVEVELTIEFQDARYDVGHEVSFKLEIVDQEIIWDNANGCFSGERFSIAATGANVTQDGKAKIVTKCKVPSNIAIGVHTLRATPTFYSEETTLNPADTEVAFVHGDSQEESEQNFFEFLFGYITRFLAGS